MGGKERGVESRKYIPRGVIGAEFLRLDVVPQASCIYFTYIHMISEPTMYCM